MTSFSCIWLISFPTQQIYCTTIQHAYNFISQTPRKMYSVTCTIIQLDPTGRYSKMDHWNFKVFVISTHKKNYPSLSCHKPDTSRPRLVGKYCRNSARFFFTHTPTHPSSRHVSKCFRGSCSALVANRQSHHKHPSLQKSAGVYPFWVLIGRPTRPPSTDPSLITTLH